MKKLLFIVSFLFCAIISFGQYPINQSLGGDSTLVTSKGGFKGRVINFQFDDTTQANTQRISQYPASQIVTKAGQFYIRDSSATKWILLGSGFSPFPTCGLENGTGIVSYDSTLDFDVSAATYALCCDGIPRQSDFTVVHLQGDPDNPRYVAIILDANGVDTVNGVPAADPALPQLTTCQIALTYVLINAGDNVPANISQTIIYDENYSSEWTLDSKRNISVDTANTTFPAHLTHDIYIDTLDKLDNYLKFKTNTAVNLNDYSLLKFYITYPSTIGISKIYLTWYLDGVQKTITKFFQFSNVVTLQYQIFSIPISAFSFIGTTDVNTLQISFSTSNTHTSFYIDWIQLQSGLIPISTIPGIQQLNVTGNALIAPTVSFPTGTNTTVALPFTSIIPHGVLYNPQDISAQPVIDTFDVSVVKGLLPVINIAPGSENQILQIVSGVPTWQDAALPASDTIAVISPIRVNLSGDPSISDTLYLNYGNGLQLVNDSLYLGGTLIRPTTINAGVVSSLNLFGSITDSSLLQINNSNGIAINAIAPLSTAVNASSDYGVAIQASTLYGTAIIGVANSSGTSDIQSLIGLHRNSQNTPEDGIGNSIDFYVEDLSGEILANSLISKLTDVTHATHTSQFIITGVDSASTVNLLTLDGTGYMLIKTMTAAVAETITPAEGIILFVTTTDGTFTSKGLWDYENSAWHKL